MQKQIKNQWQISKYNPDYRDENGYYTLKEEWTCPSEIGKIIDGNEFTLDEYLHTEAKYVDTLISFIKESRLDTLRILQLEEQDISSEDRNSFLYEPEFEELNLKEDKIVTLQDIRIIATMILRNFVYCEFYVKDRFSAYFGGDYYMYIGSSEKPLLSIAAGTEHGLFVEEIDALPYSHLEEDIFRSVEWSKKGNHLIVGEEELSEIPLEELRLIFHLSSQHPVLGFFKINSENIDFFQRYLKHEMDFDKHEYFFWSGN
ncbi:DUF7683 domain-containing protein [Alkalicoccus daliensis]|uniref:DUF7683 domain-containing protein n=1 Tax=Alkalicoccus daliensis TaxID=745820 RepID=A0A1H0ERM8_9BACI|nr:hypothetical protein [Alkalicoccus daliensis]SDN84976.1 hypothetical protein SAMN04488053_10433 [Alkalicoccus daliensis]